MHKRTALLTVALATFVITSFPAAPSAQQSGPSADPVLAPTKHPNVPADLSRLWLAPIAGGPTASLDEFTRAVRLEVDNNFAKALPIFSKPSMQQGLLGFYGQYYKGLAELRLGRAADARVTFRALTARGPVGYLVEAAALREAECNEALGDMAGALAVYERLSQMSTTAPDEVLMRLGRAARAVGDDEKATAAFSRVYFEFPLGDLAAQASGELDRVADRGAVGGTNRFRLELGRAERLFVSKRYGQARVAFLAVRNAAQGDDRDLIALRLAECQYFLKVPRAAREEVRPFLDKPALQAEAMYFYALTLRQLATESEYVHAIRRVVDEFPNQKWAADALDDLATHYILKDEDEKADEVFRELYEKFPTGRSSERAAWKLGWRAFKSGRYDDTVRVFDRASVDFPRSDYRPAWLYWSGRAYAARNDEAVAEARYTLVATDYLNSYYGRLALQQLNGRAPARPLVVNMPSPPVLPGNERLIRALLGVALYDQAIDEIRYAQKEWGDSSPLEATLAWIYQRQGKGETGERKFALYRGAINTMKRAYPQFMAAGGEGLPPELLKVIFPLDYWDLIRKHAAEHNLDPYVVAALVAQESTFVADIRSYAKAVGLMQLMPATARRTAKDLKIVYSSKLLTNPEANIHLGAAYLAEKIKEFGDLHLAVASYNAGERPVRRWMAERPGVPQDEFIDDIPFPETQLYVKKILGTAEDYRRLYGPIITASH